ncbi:hypothetical protein ABZ372_29290 [Streptomyces sp. NPDC005921]|uniref:hypothetical protein n=1 Tax=Streptomyces sp. NPDC005827 TaxID=3157070 RepID=UPI0033FAE164
MELTAPEVLSAGLGAVTLPACGDLWQAVLDSVVAGRPRKAGPGPPVRDLTWLDCGSRGRRAGSGVRSGRYRESDPDYVPDAPPAWARVVEIG